MERVEPKAFDIHDLQAVVSMMKRGSVLTAGFWKWAVHKRNAAYLAVCPSSLVFLQNSGAMVWPICRHAQTMDAFKYAH